MCFKILEVTKCVWKEELSNDKRMSSVRSTRAQGEGYAEEPCREYPLLCASFLAGCAMESARMHSDLIF